MPTDTVPPLSPCYIPIKEVPRILGNPKLNYSTLWRWMLKGSGGIRLEAVKMGMCWFTTHAALEKFGAAQAQAAIDRETAKTRAKPAPRPRPERAAPRRESQLEQDRAFLRQEGVM